MSNSDQEDGWISASTLVTTHKRDSYVTRMVMSWGLTGGQQTDTCSCKFIQRYHRLELRGGYKFIFLLLLSHECSQGPAKHNVLIRTLKKNRTP